MSKKKIIKKGKSTKNIKAYTFKSYIKANRERQRTSDLNEKKLHKIRYNRITDGGCIPPPIFIAVIGTKFVGKSTLIRSLVRYYTKYSLQVIKGPISVITGKRRRVTFLEVPNDLNAIVDTSKVCDLALLCINAKRGFEMEIFEFLNVSQVHGLPKIIGVLTHLDLFKKQKIVRKIKKEMKQRFWEEIYQGCKLFYLNGIINGKYLKRETLNLARFISIIKFRPLIWRNSHPYLIADHYEDITNPSQIRKNPKINRQLVMYGWVRGTNWEFKQNVHFLGVGDFKTDKVEKVEDPCPISFKRKYLNEKDKNLFAPMSEVGNLVFDQDAIYMDLKKKIHNEEKKNFFKKFNSEESTKQQVERIIWNLKNLKHKPKVKQNTNIFSDFRTNITEEIIEHKKNKQTDHFITMTSTSVRDLSKINKEKQSLSVLIDDMRKEINSKIFINTGNYSSLKKEASKLFSASNVNGEKNISTMQFKSIDNKGEKKIDHLRPSQSIKNVPKFTLQALESKRNEVKNKKKTLNELIYCSFNEQNKYRKKYLFLTQKEKEKKLEKSLLTSKLFLEDVDCPNFTIPIISNFIRYRFITGKWEDNDLFLKVYKNADDDEKKLTTLKEKDLQIVKTSNLHDNQFYEESETHRRLKKLRLKKTFDACYDKTIQKNHSKLLNEKKKQNNNNLKEYSNENQLFQKDLRDFLPGTYLRVEIQNVPYEFGHNFEENFPIILGGLLPNERHLGFIKAKLKKHRWFKTLLKYRNPLIISIGWRRYQTLPIYSLKDRNNVRDRMIKYTPEHQHCLAHFYGPISPPGTGIIGYLRNDSLLKSFRISATGTVLGVNSQVNVQKKLKLVGYPENICRNTCFIKEMFKSDIEASKFVGAKIKTVSNIRGVIKKVKGVNGLVRATFEDQLRMSDIVFLRSWIKIEPEKYYNPLSTLLLKNKANWRGIRTIGKICYEENIKLSRKKDSIYQIIQRPKQRFAPFRVSRKLHLNLPFKSKTKNHLRKSTKKKEQNVLKKNIKTEREKKENNFLQTLSTITHDRAIKKRKYREEKNILYYKKNKEKIFLRESNEKKKKKDIYRKKGLKNRKTKK